MNIKQLNEEMRRIVEEDGKSFNDVNKIYELIQNAYNKRIYTISLVANLGNKQIYAVTNSFGDYTNWLIEVDNVKRISAKQALTLLAGPSQLIYKAQ